MATDSNSSATADVSVATTGLRRHQRARPVPRGPLAGR